MESGETSTDAEKGEPRAARQPDHETTSDGIVETEYRIPLVLGRAKCRRW
jgi:hypothetical protein